MKNIGVLVSGGGTNLQALIDGINNGEIKNGIIKLVVSNRRDVQALDRATNNNINNKVIPKEKGMTVEEYSNSILSHMLDNNIDLIVMAGFLPIVGGNLLKEYENRIMNIHPSLIPAFCGDKMYGIHVHEAILQRGVKVTGATTHYVTGVTDGGPIIMQKAVDVLEDDTPLILQRRVMEEAEWIILPKSVSQHCEDKIEVVDGKVKKKIKKT